MINVFKAGGAWKSGSFDYTVKCVEKPEALELSEDGWFKTLEEAKASKPKKVTAKKVANKDDNEGSDS